jgi:hypothetical protein
MARKAGCALAGLERTWPVSDQIGSDPRWRRPDRRSPNRIEHAKWRAAGQGYAARAPRRLRSAPTPGGALIGAAIAISSAWTPRIDQATRRAWRLDDAMAAPLPQGERGGIFLCQTHLSTPANRPPCVRDAPAMHPRLNRCARAKNPPHARARTAKRNVNPP